jgi:glycosyltransferase involved in cell wall biosynthesis
MIDGFHLFQKRHDDISLLMVWSWQEEQKVKEYIQEKYIKNVFFTWYVQIDELPKYYAISDIFTLPSREEVWWLVINEAMACGLPIITAYQVWASVDLVQEGENGYIMKENTAKEFEKWLEFIFEKKLMKENNSLDIIDKFTLENILKNSEFAS